jgi:hypothetical protein
MSFEGFGDWVDELLDCQPLHFFSLVSPTESVVVPVPISLSHFKPPSPI